MSTIQRYETKRNLKPDITVGWELVTADVASDLLRRNDRNRPMIKSRVVAYGRDLEAGNWKATAEPIQVGEDGTLLNGQNRLQAIVNTGIATWLVVARGLADDAIDAMDQGAKRSAGQIFAIRREEYAFPLAAVCTLRWKWDNAWPYGATPTMSEIEETLEKHPDMRRSVKFAAVNPVTGLTTSPAGFLHHLFAKLDQDDADDFFGALSSGVNLTEDSPIRNVREALIQNRDAKRKVSSEEVLAWTIKGWNAYRAGRVIRSLRWRSEGPRAESFPRPE